MRSAILFTLAFALFSPVFLQAQTEQKKDIEVSSAVLKTAEWAGFKYMENLELAKTGEPKALKAIFDFHGTVDGVESLQHATTCIELIPFATDERVGVVISNLKPKLKKVMLDRFQLALVRTKKEELRKPLQEWAPLTWKALNGEMVVCTTCMHESADLNPDNRKGKPGATTPGAAQQVPAGATDSETGKQ